MRPSSLRFRSVSFRIGTRPSAARRRTAPARPVSSGERRGRLRPTALAPSRRRLSDLTLIALFQTGDAVALAVAFALQGWIAAAPATPLALALAAAQWLAVVWSLQATGLYRLGARARLAGRGLRALAGFGLAALIVAPIYRVLAPGSLAGGLERLVVDLPLVLVLQGLWQAATRRWRAQGRLTPNIAIVGATAGAARFIDELAADGRAAVVGVFDDRAWRTPRSLAGAPVLGGVDALVSHRLLPFIDIIVIAVPPSAIGRVGDLIDRLAHLPNDIMLLVEGDPQAPAPLAAAQRLDRARLQRLAGRPSDERRALIKRVQDLVLGSLALALAFPILVLVAAAIALESPGPILFRQRRHGFNNEEIVVLKFRSMRCQSDEEAAARQVSAEDERITRVGRFIRKTSLDELPQLLNVLAGEMSLVGPRPHAVGMKTGEVESAALVAGYAHRHRIKPGMTGWAAIHGSRGPVATAADVARRVALDVEYIERQSFWIDLWIMLATLPCLLGDRSSVR